MGEQYDTRKIEVNQFFIADHPDHSVDGNSPFTYEEGCYYAMNGTTWTKYEENDDPNAVYWNTIIIEADSTSVNRYDIQLYMKDTIIPFNQIGTYVTFNANAPASDNS